MQFVAQGHEPPPISLGIAVVDEVAIVLVRHMDAPRVPNRTPILFGPARDLTYVGKHAIGVPQNMQLSFWSSQDSVETSSTPFQCCLELLWADAAEVTVASGVIVEAVDVIGNVV